MNQSQLDSAILTTARNPTDIAPLLTPFSDPPTFADLEALREKLNDLIAALQRV